MSSSTTNAEGAAATKKEASLDKKKKAMLNGATNVNDASGGEKVSEKKMLINGLEAIIARLANMRNDSYVCTSAELDAQKKEIVKIYYGGSAGEKSE